MTKLYDLYMDNLGPLKVMTIFMSLISAAVMALQYVVDDLNQNLAYLSSIFPFWIWATLFGVFTISRSILLWTQESRWYAALLTSLLGIWLWSLMLVSATFITKIGGIDLMLTIPLFTELWIMARIIEKRKGN